MHMRMNGGPMLTRNSGEAFCRVHEERFSESLSENG